MFHKALMRNVTDNILSGCCSFCSIGPPGALLLLKYVNERDDVMTDPEICVCFEQGYFGAVGALLGLPNFS